MADLWLGKNHEHIEICKMTDLHLLNSIALLERMAREKMSYDEIKDAYDIEDYLDDTNHADLVIEAEERGIL